VFFVEGLGVELTEFVVEVMKMGGDVEHLVLSAKDER
jgi:hypothetical protein